MVALLETLPGIILTQIFNPCTVCRCYFLDNFPSPSISISIQFWSDHLTQYYSCVVGNSGHLRLDHSGLLTPSTAGIILPLIFDYRWYFLSSPLVGKSGHLTLDHSGVLTASTAGIILAQLRFSIPADATSSPTPSHFLSHNLQYWQPHFSSSFDYTIHQKNQTSTFLLATLDNLVCTVVGRQFCASKNETHQIVRDAGCNIPSLQHPQPTATHILQDF